MIIKECFLARLNEVQEELLHCPRRRREQKLVFTLKFLCDGQGADRRAILPCVRSFLISH